MRKEKDGEEKADTHMGASRSESKSNRKKNELRAKSTEKEKRQGRRHQLCKQKNKNKQRMKVMKKDESKKNIKRKTPCFIDSWLTCLLTPSAEQLFWNNPNTEDRTAQENDQISARGQGDALTFGTQSASFSFHEFN